MYFEYIYFVLCDFEFLTYDYKIWVMCFALVYINFFCPEKSHVIFNMMIKEKSAMTV